MSCTSIINCSVLSCAYSRNSRWRSLSLPTCSSSTIKRKPLMALSGVRSSWENIEIKLLRARLAVSTARIPPEPGSEVASSPSCSTAAYSLLSLFRCPFIPGVILGASYTIQATHAMRLLANELIANSARRLNILGICRVSLNLAPQPPDIDIDNVALALIIFPPDGIKQLFSPENLTETPGQHQHNLHLPGCQQHNPLIGKAHLEISD